MWLLTSQPDSLMHSCIFPWGANLTNASLCLILMAMTKMLLTSASQVNVHVVRFCLLFVHCDEGMLLLLSVGSTVRGQSHHFTHRVAIHTPKTILARATSSTLTVTTIVTRPWHGHPLTSPVSLSVGGKWDVLLS